MLPATSLQITLNAHALNKAADRIFSSALQNLFGFCRALPQLCRVPVVPTVDQHHTKDCETNFKPFVFWNVNRGYA